MTARRTTYAALVAVQVCFSTLPIAAKVALRELSSPALALLRVAGAALLFLVLQRALVGERVGSWRDHGRLALYALFGVVANQLLYITALTLTTATAAQTMMAAGPAITLLVAIVLGRESATLAKWAGIGTAAAGALALVGVGFGTGGWLGNLLALLNVTAFGVYLVISRDILRRYDPMTVITWVFVWGAVGIAPWGLPAFVPLPSGFSAATWAALAWIVVVPTVGAYYLNTWALKRADASVVAVFIYLQPLVTAALAVWLLGERPSPMLVPAALLIFLGVGLTAWAERRARAARRREMLAEGCAAGVALAEGDADEDDGTGDADGERRAAEA